MKQLYLLLVGLVVACFAFTGCTENQIARKLGGNMEITLKPNEKLMMATWKDDNLFYLTEPMDSDYVPKTKTLYEHSSFGMLETTVVFIESR